MHPSRRLRCAGLRRHLTTVVILVVGLVAFAPLSPQSSLATEGNDDYPARLKSAAQDALVDPWMFYNRECTSFVAWRLNHDAGVDFSNYYGGVHWGDASNWRYAANQIGVPVDSSPIRGSVAWWAAGSPGSSRGHVAWVLSHTRTSITIEEYNYLSAGHYDQRTISTGSSMWPSAFLHIGSLSLRNTAAPTVNGKPKVGAKLTARPGSWTPSGATYSYQWLGDGVPIRDAIHRSFAPRPAQLGERLQVRVTAKTDASKPVAVTSPRTDAVVPGDLQSTARPTIIGTAQVGTKLTATPGSWTPSGATYSYQWLADGAEITGATHRSFVPQADQLGHQLRVQVTASATAMDPGTATSIRTADVVPGELVLSDRPAVTGTPQVDTQLSATHGTWSPNADFTYQWSAGGDPVDGAVDSTFTPSADQLGQRVTVTVTAQRDGYTTATSRSVLTGAVHRASFATTGPPTISGTAQVDRPLTASPGDWSPAGTPTYQWFVDGQAVPGATATTFTPRPSDLRSQVTVQVRMTRPGYRTTTSSSVATDAVLPGTFQNLSDPTISGTPRVGLTLTAHPGGWSPEPTLSYQWYADGTAVPGANEITFTPTASEEAKRITVEVTARRTAYLTALTTSAATARVEPGTITSVDRPGISGDPVVGAMLTASPGTWSVNHISVAYQWYADGVAIGGANGSTFPLTSAVLDKRLSVEVTVSRAGYTPTSRTSRETDPVVLGQVEFRTTPTLTGTSVVGRLLTADAGAVKPSSATPAYTWLRSGAPIADATGATYRLAPTDVGQRISVRITLTAPHWASRSTRVGIPGKVKSPPTISVRSSVFGHKVVLHVHVVAPGIRGPEGKVVVTEDGTKVGVALVSGGRGSLELGHVLPGRHRYTLTYTGPMQTPKTQHVDVTLP